MSVFSEDSALDRLCRERVGKGEDWSIYSLTCLPRGAKNCTHVECIGSRHYVGKRGPRKGERRWTMEDVATVILSIDEYRACFKKEEAP